MPDNDDINVPYKDDGHNQSIFKHPTIADYYANVTPFITLSIVVATLLVLLNISIFCATSSKILKRFDHALRRPSIGLCSLYPVICCAALVTITVPKAWLLCHTVMHLSFTVGAVIFRQFCFLIVGSELNYMKENDNAPITVNTPPCCCCCLCLPGVVPSRAKLCLLRYMVWQMPFVQGSIMVVLNVIYYREEELFHTVGLYFMPFIVCSIVFGIWALNITVRMVTTIHSQYGLMRKLFCLQLILLLCKLQYMLLDSQLDHIILGGSYPINHTIYKQTIINLLILFEMVLVSLLAQNAYKMPV